jgi:hypothetical protein
LGTQSEGIKEKPVIGTNIATDWLSLDRDNMEKDCWIGMDAVLGSSLCFPTLKFCDLDKFTTFTGPTLL